MELFGLANRKAPSATMGYNEWLRGAGVSDTAYSALDDASKEGLSQAFNTNPVSSGFNGSEMLGLAGLGLKGLGAFTDWQQLGVAKDTLAFNKMNANRNYEADKTKYNNAYDRTDAVNKVYGSPTVGTKI